MEPMYAPPQMPRNPPPAMLLTRAIASRNATASTPGVGTLAMHHARADLEEAETAFREASAKIDALRQELHQRHYGQAMRLEVSSACSEGLADFLLRRKEGCA